MHPHANLFPSNSVERTHEEADTRMVLQVLNTLEARAQSTLMTRTDVFVLLLIAETLESATWKKEEAQRPEKSR